MAKKPINMLSTWIYVALLCPLLIDANLLYFRRCSATRPLPPNIVGSCPFNTIAQKQDGVIGCCVDCSRFKNNATVRVYRDKSARSLIGYATCPDPNRHSEKIAHATDGTQVILPSGTDVRACCIRVGPSNCYYSLPAVSSLVGSESLSRLVEQVCKVTALHVSPLTPIHATASLSKSVGEPHGRGPMGVPPPDTDSCGLRFVKSGEQVPTGVQRLFASFQKASSPTFGKTQWLISPPARVGIAVVGTGADYWHPDFCNNCPLSHPLPPNMDTILHQGIAIIPTTDNSPLNPDPPPTMDDNGGSTWSTGYSPPFICDANSLQDYRCAK